MPVKLFWYVMACQFACQGWRNSSHTTRKHLLATPTLTKASGNAGFIGLGGDSGSSHIG
jgi:hypothetical protein